MTHCLLKNHQKLSIGRKPDQKVLGACRDSALLLCSILRSRGIPARLRAGFNTYYNANFYLDGFCLQYFDFKLNRWRMVDPRTTKQTIRSYQLSINFNITDLSEQQFILAAKAWQLCRAGKANPNSFGFRHYSGLPYLQTKLIQDFLLLNKYELLIWDLWGMMLNHNADHYSLMDELSNFMIGYENDVNKIQDCYQKHKTLHVPEQVLVANPFLPERWETLLC